MRALQLTRTAAWFRVVVAIVAPLLSLLVAVGPAAPSYAHLVAGPAVHNCHCEARGGHAECACPICFPELRSPDDAFAPNLLKSSCGDDEPGWRSDAPRAVPSSTLVVVAAPLPERVAPPLPMMAPPRLALTPDPRPPREARAALSA